MHTNPTPSETQHRGRSLSEDGSETPANLGELPSKVGGYWDNLGDAEAGWQTILGGLFSHEDPGAGKCHFGALPLELAPTI